MSFVEISSGVTTPVPCLESRACIEGHRKTMDLSGEPCQATSDRPIPLGHAIFQPSSRLPSYLSYLGRETSSPRPWTSRLIPSPHPQPQYPSQILSILGNRTEPTPPNAFQRAPSVPASSPSPPSVPLLRPYPASGTGHPIECGPRSHTPRFPDPDFLPWRRSHRYFLGPAPGALMPEQLSAMLEGASVQERTGLSHEKMVRSCAL